MFAFQPTVLRSTFPPTQKFVYFLEPTHDDSKPSQSNGENVVVKTLSSEVKEIENHYELEMDVPGVKLSDIKVEIVKDSILRVSAERKTGNTPTVRYMKQFAIDKKAVNLSEVRAELEDGVLRLRMQKKQPDQPVHVEITTAPPHEDETKTSDDKIMKLDLPGVKTGDLDVTLHDGKINIKAKRTRGNNIINISKVYEIDESRLDGKKMTGYLADGVLTIQAPIAESPGEVTPKPSDIKTIAVVCPTSNSNPQEHGKSRTTEDKIPVETVEDKD